MIVLFDPLERCYAMLIYECVLIILMTDTNVQLRRFGRSPDRSVGGGYEWGADCIYLIYDLRSSVYLNYSPSVVPEKGETQSLFGVLWIPAFAGMTSINAYVLYCIKLLKLLQLTQS